MSFTDGKWEQGTPQSDLQFFVGADQFTDFAAVSTLPAAPAAGLLFKTVPNNGAAKFFVTLESLLMRSGVYANAALDQSQFGTGAAQPGPTTVANTTGPLALKAGYPPIAGAQMPTVGSVQIGPLAKGMQINSIDVVYQVLGLAAALATVGLTKTVFANLVAPVVSNIIALGANGLPTAIGAQPQVTNVAVGAPAMIVPASPTQTILNVNLTGGVTGTVQFIGVNLRLSYNLN